MEISRERIFQILKSAGAIRTYSCCGIEDKLCGTDEWRGNMEAVVKIAYAAGQEASREECAKLCGAYWESLEEIGEDDYQTGRARAAVDLQNAITTRSQPPKGEEQK